MNNLQISSKKGDTESFLPDHLFNKNIKYQYVEWGQVIAEIRAGGHTFNFNEGPETYLFLT